MEKITLDLLTDFCRHQYGKDMHKKEITGYKILDYGGTVFIHWKGITSGETGNFFTDLLTIMSFIYSNSSRINN
jgi:hypothetical protein